MLALQEKVQKEYEQWENTPPNMVNEKLGQLTKPMVFLVEPVIKRVVFLLECVISKANEYVASAVKKYSDKVPNFEDMDEKSFEEWFAKADKQAEKLKMAGIAAVSVEGGVTGFFGAKGLLADIPAVFGLIFSFSNKIALTYGLPIKSQEIQIEILNAIRAGSASSVKEKAKLATDNIAPAMIMAVEKILEKLGVDVTKRKSFQLIPILGAGAGIIINGAWALDTLEAVRQNSRKWIVIKQGEKYGISR